MMVDISEVDSDEHFIRVDDTHVGKGIFAIRPYPKTAIIGEIKGDLVTPENGSSEYTFDFEDGLQLEPFTPFRFVNHSCEPNCEFDILEEPAPDEVLGIRKLYLIALRDILPEEELTISYNWPADCAIECHCGSESCVGWIVCETEIDQLIDHYDDDFESEYEFNEVGYFFPD